MDDLGIYVHIPYCVRRCPYCGFYSNAIAERGYAYDIASYFYMLEKELEFRYRELGSSFYVDSIYFGGGTPTLASPELIGRIIDKIASLYHVASGCEISMEANPGTLSGSRVSGGCEISVEANPGKLSGSVDHKTAADSAVCAAGSIDRFSAADAVARLKAYRAAGVNRLSLGIQSFDDGVLKTLGRIHSADEGRKGFDDARAAGFDNVSVDLMFGVPGQTEEIWESTVAEAVSMLPEHVSFYSLQIEEGTKFYRDYKMGDMVPVTDEEDRRMYHTAIQMLRDHGYSQYEISNAALPGRECRHNLKYWTFRDYLGIGASASSFISKVRRTDPGDGYEGSSVNDLVVENVRRTNPGDGYEDFAAAGFQASGLSEDHVNSSFDSAADYMITGLRLTGGVSEADFAARFGKSIWEIFPSARDGLSEFFDGGYIIEENGRLYISEQGFDVSNKILEWFV